MKLYYKTTNKMIYKNSKLNYLAPNVLRSVYLISLSPIHHSSEKKVFARGSCIPKVYESFELLFIKVKLQV